ncbi:hypothetical protein K438DRAFT_2026283 [Mycena galopus ATCC 62051]|nr:hypothetical protein K438DRAFT_2026283 [Mycena galopus ATCC 62051]
MTNNPSTTECRRGHTPHVGWVSSPSTYYLGDVAGVYVASDPSDASKSGTLGPTAGSARRPAHITTPHNAPMLQPLSYAARWQARERRRHHPSV